MASQLPNNHKNGYPQASNDSQEDKEEPNFIEGMPGEEIINFSFEIVEKFLSKLGLNVSRLGFTFFLGLFWLIYIQIPEHHQKARSDNWNLINSASEQSGDGGRTSSLEDLNNWQKQRLQWNIPFVSDLILGNEIKLEALKASNANLSGIKLDRAVLNYANFQQSQFWNANFEKAELKNVNFQRAILAGANLNDAQLQGANLSSANLSCFSKDSQQQNKQKIQPPCTDLKNADLTGAKLIGANLIGANLENANLKDTDLTRSIYNQQTLDTVNNSDFRHSLKSLGYIIKPGIKLIRNDLTEVNLSGADLSNAKFIGVNLSGADLSNAKLKDAKFIRSVYTETTKFPDGYYPKGAYLIKPGVSLISKNLQSVNLNNANLHGVNLTDANLAGAILTDADLTNAQLKGANLENANLENAKVSDEQLNAAKNLCNATMPNGERSKFVCQK
ncbi:pentapeptide repeat-containing protein [Nostocaceae cyanobacterium CENA357]|uniref:Pentapeptide repeat-containing protein n=1 Tax=Atlanticothrix silvestris CENA357 TaxID=1725252 RepID=A0A8J7HIV7_9CYAN|nr:pentapeptide repeat-containing protein [Atlanticothrix silvestris]MBH8553371.1 pentapeptide repeat-containing protein [Atlanticothrix silvestris CENA357]